MDITDRASKLLADALENNHCTKVRLSMRDTGGFDKALDIKLVDAEDETPVMFNGIPVVMDLQTKWMTAGMILDEKDGELVIQRQQGCGCSCGRGGF